MNKDYFKKFFAFIVGGVFLLGFFNFALAQNQNQENLEINFFYSKTCPHCAKEEQFLKQLHRDYPSIKINEYVASNKKNFNLLKNFYEDYSVPKRAYGIVPATFVEDNYFIGFDESIGKEIKECVENKLKNYSNQDNCHKDCDCEGGEDKDCCREDCDCQSKEKESHKANLPFVGEIDIYDYSLPALAVILGGLDGFNVCSLGALILILGLVLAFKKRRKIFLVGGVFLLITAIIYGLLIVLWYQIFSVLSPYIRIMEILIGLIGILGGFYFLKEFWRFKKQGATCDSGIGSNLISRFYEKLKNILQNSDNILLILLFVLLFAAIITIVEFPCSAAVPLMFAGVLAKANVGGLAYLSYIGIFVIFYLLDEIIIFLLAVFTLKLKGLIPNKLMRWIVLLEALILFFLGFYYIFGFDLFL